MAAPLYESLIALAETNPLRMHMPGHKGHFDGLFSDIAQIDFTEIDPTGNLYTGEGPIAQAEALAAAFAGADDALFFTCGSTQGIYTMLAAAVGMGGELILDRSCHKSIYHAMALLDITPHYIYSTLLPGTDISAPISVDAILQAIKQYPNSRAVFLTSPSYYGVITPIAAIADLCHKNDIALLVDQAHGAHFPAVSIPSAAAEGADLSVVSTHKTWPALGASSILYIGIGAPYDRLDLKKTAQIFGTTSPSYPILASIDYGRDQLEGTAGIQYRACAHQVAELRLWINRTTPFRALTSSGQVSLDPCRLTVNTMIGGLFGFDADQQLQEMGIYVEMSDSHHLVFILTSADTPDSFTRLKTAFSVLSRRAQTTSAPLPLISAPAPIPRMSIREAVFGPRESMPLRDAAGQISADFVAPYPPGIPIIAPGEEITEKHIAYLEKKSYNIDKCVYVH